MNAYSEFFIKRIQFTSTIYKPFQPFLFIQKQIHSLQSHSQALIQTLKKMSNVHVNPGPIIKDVLFIERNHKALYMFQNNPVNYEAMTSKRGDSRFWKHYKSIHLTTEVRDIISDVGMIGVCDCYSTKLDMGFIHALVERWRPETNTFHLPIGETTVTLQDVNVLWGLPIDGEVFSGSEPKFSKQEMSAMCRDLLGFNPDESDFSGRRIKTARLFDEFEKDFPSTEDVMLNNQRARLIIFILCSVVLFPNMKNNEASFHYLNFLSDLERCEGISWGSAVLTCLYSNLSKASEIDTRLITGPLYLLQIWAYERFPNIAPIPRCEINHLRPLGFRYVYLIIII